MKTTGTVDQVFGADGPLSRALPGFESRPGQVAMAQLVERGLLEGVHTIVEAGTGVGKSLAYLVPAVRSGKKVVVSTGTIALQEQLVGKDIPLVARALETPLRVTLLKGRNHYLCKQKFERLRADRLVASSRSMQHLWTWAQATQTGDRAELTFVPAADEWEQLDADADDCVGEFCPHFRDCHYFRKRDEAKYADLVVVNHALFFLDLAMGGGLLPPYDVAILDEAHQCERWATDALTATLSRTSVGRMLRKLHRVYELPAAFDARFDEGIRGMESAFARVPGERYPLAANEFAWTALDELRDALYQLENWLFANWHSALKSKPDNDAEAERRRDLAIRSVTAHSAAIERAAAPSDQAIAWVERGESDGRFSLHCAPHDVADFLRETLFARTQSVVLTSATIAPFTFLRRSLGIDDAEELIAPSPFDFERQARLFVAPAKLNPKSSNFARHAAPLVEECLDRSRGRAFVLFTSYARLREVYALVRDRVAFPVRLQGELPRTALLEWFRRTPNAVLFATGTFWEGIDVVGDALSCVIIDRLPFPAPSDPLVMARLRALEARGLDGFEHYMIPAATVRLKQGFGRLIRSATDRGVVALLDGRAASTRYGTTILGALPQARRIAHLDELADFFPRSGGASLGG
ncbi:MAG: ATP-dependent DNA helicase [Candidatus Eremiobacteraeota bacterium]|nr:ATP-dependent DNA helicase [Candidatus Eremiobacteraeota bacterium]